LAPQHLIRAPQLMSDSGSPPVQADPAWPTLSFRYRSGRLTRAGQGAGRCAHSCWAFSNSATARGPLRSRCSVNRLRSVYRNSACCVSYITGMVAGGCSPRAARNRSRKASTGPGRIVSASGQQRWSARRRAVQWQLAGARHRHCGAGTTASPGEAAPWTGPFRDRHNGPVAAPR
jgi:hypothetical protein